MEENANNSEVDINKFLKEIESLGGKLEANPDSMVFAPLADAYRKSGMLDQAEEVCQLGLEKHPQFSSARVVLGRIFLEQKKYSEAAEEFRQVLKDEMDNLMANTLIGHALLGERKFKEAAEALRRALVLNPDDPGLQSTLDDAIAYSKGLKEPPPEEESEPTLVEAVDGKPETKTVAPAEPPEDVVPAKIELAKDAGERVEDKAEGPAPIKATGSGAGNITASLKVAEMHMKRGNFDLAVPIYEEVVAADPDNLIAHSKLKEACAKVDAAAGDPSITSAVKEETSVSTGDGVVAESEAAVAEQREAEDGVTDLKGGMLDLDLPLVDMAGLEKSTGEKENDAAEQDLAVKEVPGREDKEDAVIEQGPTTEVSSAREEETGGQAAAAVAEDDESMADVAAGVLDEVGGEVADKGVSGDDELAGVALVEPVEEASVALAEEESESVSAAAAVIDEPQETLMQSPGEGVDFTAVLARLNETAGIVGSMLVAPGDGSVFDQVLTVEMDTSEIGQMVSAIYNNVHKSVNSLNQGKLTQVLITARDGQVFLNTTSYGVLAILANEKIRIGMLRLALKEAVNDIEKTVREG